MVLFLALFLSVGSKTTAQTTEQYLSQIALEQFEQKEEFAQMRMSIENQNTEVQYSPFEVSFVEVHDDWARVHIMSNPNVVFNQEGQHQWPKFQGAVANFRNNEWIVYFENSSEFGEIKTAFPAWLQFLNAESELNLNSFSEMTAYVETFPGLPWQIGTSWDHNQGFTNHCYREDGTRYNCPAIDFGTPVGGDTDLGSDAVYALDGGEILRSNSTCMYIKSTSGAILFYQHLNANELAETRLDPGKRLNYGDYLAHTTISPGCDGFSGGHHLHLEVQLNNPGNRVDFVGSSFNGWLVGTGGKLTKDNIVIAAGSEGDIYHNGCAGYFIDAQYPVILHDGIECQGEQKIIYNPMQYPANLDQYGWDNRTASVNVLPGYSLLIWTEPVNQTGGNNPEPICFQGDMWDLRKDHNPLTGNQLYQDISAVQLVSGSCNEQPNPCVQPTSMMMNKAGEINASNNMCSPTSPPPPDTLPLPPGPQTGNGGGVKLYQYPNYEGELLYTFNVGFSNEPNAEGYSMQVPNGWSVITYREDNMGGMSECWNANVPNFQDHNDWQTKVQSIQIFNQDMCPTDPPNPTQPPNVQFFSGTGYQGSGPSYNLGFHDHQYFYAGSLSLKTGSSVVLYRIDKRQSVNQAFCFNRSVPNLDAAGWPYQIVGLEVFNFDLCQDQLIETHDYIVYQDEGVQFANCGGHGPTSVADLTNWCGTNWNDQISSLRIKAGWSIKVWEHANYQGGDKCFSTSMTTFRNDALSNGVSISVGEGDSVISSFAVFDNEYCDGSPEMPQSAWGYSNNNGNLALGQFVMSAEENDNQSITVEWEQSTDSSTQGYHIYEHADDDFYALVATIDSRYTTSWTFNDLPCGTDYHYLVKAFNNWGDSATPNLVAVSTPSCYVEPVWGGAIYLPLVIKPGNTQPPQEGPTPNAPSGLHVTTVGQNSITVAWDDNSTIEDNFEVWYQADGGQWVNPTVAANTESYTVSGLECETQYHFVVRAINWDNGNLYYSESNFVSANTDTCDPVEGPTPNAPTDLHKTSSTTTSISVMWNDNSNIELEYRLGYKATTSADTFFVYLPVDSESYTVTGLDCSLQYEIWVTALNTPYYAHSNNIYVYPSSCQ